VTRGTFYCECTTKQKEIDKKENDQQKKLHFRVRATGEND
jgi:hypothetical protein